MQLIIVVSNDRISSWLMAREDLNGTLSVEKIEYNTNSYRFQ